MKIITTTERLIIREFTLEDAQAVFDFNEPEEVNRYTGDAGVCQSVDDALTIIRSIWLKEYASNGFGRWAVVLKESGKVIGFCGFKKETGSDGVDYDYVDIGYRLHPDYWGKGYATEANQACVDYAKQHLDLDEVYGDVIPDNHGSVNVLKKLGMTFLSQHQEQGATLDRYHFHL